MARNTKKLNMAAMKAAAKNLNIKLPKGDPKVAAQALREHFTSNHEENALMACGNCGWEATEDHKTCPYCGISLGAPEEGHEPPGDEPPKTKTPKTKTPKGKGSQAARKKSGALAKPDKKKIAECDARVAKIQGYRRSLAAEAYNIGTELKAIHDGNLWKHKGHKSFKSFVQEELDYTRVMAYKYMSMAGSVKKEDAIKLGVSKVDMIVNAPQKRQKKLLEMGKEGKSRKDMEFWLKKVEGKTSSAGEGGKKDSDKITLVGRANMGDTFVSWLGDKSGKPTGRDTTGKHAEFHDIVSGFTLFMREDDKGKGLVCTLKKDDEPAPPSKEEPAPPNKEEDAK
jgi:hypothetical protein